MARKPTASDFKEHERTYHGFLTVTKWSVIAIVVTLVILYFLVNP